MKKAHNRIEMEDKTFNNWKVIEYSHTKGKIIYWKCLCTSCNSTHSVDGRNLRSGRSKQCVACGREKTRRANVGKKLSNETKSKIAEKAKGREVSEDTKEKLRGFKLSQCNQDLANLDPTPSSKGRGLRISKKINEIVQRAKKRKKSVGITKLTMAKMLLLNCEYCGIEPKPYNTIDRIDSSIGYEKDNVVSCCLTCNLAKNTMSVTEFKEWIKRIHSNINNF